MNTEQKKSKQLNRRIVAAIGVAAIVVLTVLNLLLVHIGTVNQLFIDTTPEGLYTLTPTMKEQCSFINELEDDEREVKITFCNDPDKLIASQTTRLPYFMALQMAQNFDRVAVETVNVIYNPTAVSKYKSTSLTSISPTDIVVSYGDRYRVVSLESFWVANSEGLIWAFNGEYKLASIIMSVTSKNRPKAYFVTNHGETYYDPENPTSEGSLETAYLYDLLTERGLEVKNLDLSEVDRVPEDCVLLIINNPQTDYAADPDRLDEFGYISETEKLDRYLVADYGSIMVAKDYALSLHDLDAFLYEWGFDIGEGVVKDESSFLTSEDGDFDRLVGVYDTDENSYGYAIYGDFAALGTSPAMVFDNCGYIESSYGSTWSVSEDGTYTISRNYAPLFYTTQNAKSYTQTAGGALEVSSEGVMHVAGVTTRMELNSVTSENKYSYIFATPCGDFFSNDLLGNTSYANYDIMSALVENVSRADEYASIELGGTSYNSPNLGGKPMLDTTILPQDTYEYDSAAGGDVLVLNGLGANESYLLFGLLLAIPVAVGIAGIVICIKRKYM